MGVVAGLGAVFVEGDPWRGLARTLGVKNDAQPLEATMTVRPASRMRARGGRRALLPLAAAVGAAGAIGAVATSGLGVGVGIAGASTKATTVTAIETDFHIALSKKTFSPGRYTFVAKNKGQTTHALQITGPGLSSDATTKNISPGQSAKLTVTFKKGAYDIFCPVPGHKQLGMNINLSVGGGASATATVKSPGSGSGAGSNASAGAGGTAF
jgi:uncharacterized cupredoxin-like copper-binding protein